MLIDKNARGSFPFNTKARCILYPNNSLSGASHHPQQLAWHVVGQVVIGAAIRRIRPLAGAQAKRPAARRSQKTNLSAYSKLRPEYKLAKMAITYFGWIR